MSLRVRFILVTLLLVSLMAVVLSALQLQSLVDSMSRELHTPAAVVPKQTSDFLIDEITARQSMYPAPESDQQRQDLWVKIIAEDPDVPRFLSRTMAPWEDSISEINVADGTGKILASSNPDATGRMLRPRQALNDWIELPWYQRARELMSNVIYWEVTPPPIGMGEAPVLRIQVVTSSVLATVKPLVTDMAKAVGLILLVALIIALLVTSSAMRPLKRIELTIDRLAQGKFSSTKEPEERLGKEFAAVQSKLTLLGQHMQEQSGIIKPGDLDGLMRRVEKQFDVAQRLTAISRLSGGVAHEIKNPLNAILLRLDLLKVRLGDGDEEVTKELEILSKEVLRLNRVVTTFLDFSKPVEVHFTDVDLKALASEVAELVRPQAAVSKIEVTCSGPAESASMRGDPDLLKQAILNLVTNAVEAMGPTGGKLDLAVTRADENWVLEVADTGPGIPEAMRDKVFQLYFTSKSKGSGIGLAMTYRAAQLHNGTVRFTSESGKGTTFRLEFPVAVTHA